MTTRAQQYFTDSHIGESYEQGVGTRPKAQGYGASINGIWYRLAANPDSPLRIGTRDSLAERLDQKGSVAENVLDIGYAFSRNNMTGGEGLDWFPRVSQLGESAPLDTIRYWDSLNLAIERPDAGQPYTIKLSHTHEIFYTPPTPPIDMTASSDSIYVIYGNTVVWFDDWQNNVPIGTQDFGTPLALVVANPGNEVFILTAAGHLWYKPWDDSVFVEVYDLTGSGFNTRPLTNIWLVKGRLLAERVATVGQIQGTVELVDGTPVGVGDPTDPTWVLEFQVIDSARGSFRRVIDAGVAVVAIVEDGTVRSYVPQADTGGGDPSLTIRGSSQVALGEEPLSIGWGNGIVVLLTTANEDNATGTHTIRAYQAQVLSEQYDFIVGNMQLLRSWRGADEPPSKTKNMPNSRDRIYWTVEESPDSEYLWAFDTVTTGIMRVRELTGGDVTAIILFDTRGGVIQGDNIMVTDPDHLMSSGYLITPNINFGLNTSINWTESILECLELDGTTQVDLYYTIDPEAVRDPNSPNWNAITTVRYQSQQGIEIPRPAVTSKSLALMVKLTPSSDLTKTPIVTRLAVRGMPKHRDFIVELPVNISDQISAPGRLPYRLGGYGDIIHRRLLDLSGAAAEVTVLEPPITVRGTIDTVLEPVEYISERGSVGRYCMVRIRGSRVTQPGTGIATNQGLGVASLGIAGLGIESTVTSGT